ncbi:MAG: hypothetical protein HRU03_09215 [Nanoarchaeales archaeon]|nr:hypothetical protein [Nanoarchaeales archaeon]
MAFNYSQIINQILEKTFKTDKSLKKALLNNEIHKLDQLNITQLLKIFDIEIDSKLYDSNAKKHLVKVQDMITSGFYNEKTNNYLRKLFYPQNDDKIYFQRKKAIEVLNQISSDTTQFPDLKENINDIENLNGKVTLFQSFYTLEEDIEEKLYAKYKIKIQVLTMKEFQDNYTKFDEDSVFITNEDLMIDFPTYKPDEFEQIIIGNIIKNNRYKIENLVEILDKTKQTQSQDIIEQFAAEFKTDIKVNLDSQKLLETLNEERGDELKELTKSVINMGEDLKQINLKLREKIEGQSINLQGAELIKLLNSGNLKQIQDKIKDETYDLIKESEQTLIKKFKDAKLKCNYIFSNSAYPIELDEDVQKDLLNQTERMEKELEYEEYKILSKFSITEIKKLYNYSYFTDLVYGIKKFINKHQLNYPTLQKENYILQGGRNIYINNANPITYGLSTDKLLDTKLNNEKISVLTGANSGGKTTLLEMFLQSQVLTSLGFPINADKSSTVKFYDENIYLKKFTGTQGSGAFEQTIRNLVEILDSQTSKFLLIDEFEAVTEPGAAAKILINFLTELNKKDINAIAVSHLGLEIKDYLELHKITSIRIDGISAKGLDEKGDLITTHQPEFYELGKSTPELILKRIIQDESFWKNKGKEAKEILMKMI